MNDQTYKTMERVINQIATSMGYTGSLEEKCEKISKVYDVVTNMMPDIKKTAETMMPDFMKDR
jgi:UTP:GlnB (protein PII) uridylyltransferase